MLKELVELANELDQAGQIKKADQLDRIIEKIAQDLEKAPYWAGPDELGTGFHAIESIRDSLYQQAGIPLIERHPVSTRERLAQYVLDDGTLKGAIDIKMKELYEFMWKNKDAPGTDEAKVMTHVMQSPIDLSGKGYRIRWPSKRTPLPAPQTLDDERSIEREKHIEQALKELEK